MREDVVGDGQPAQGMACREPMVLPQAVHENRIEARRVLAQPQRCAGGEAVCPAPGAERRHGHRCVRYGRSAWGIERGDFDAVPESCQCQRRLTHAFHGAPGGGIQRGQDLQEFHIERFKRVRRRVCVPTRACVPYGRERVVRARPIARAWRS